MPTKRRVLETLSLKELQDLASTYELEVGDRRVRDQLIEAAGNSRKVPLAEVLGAYPRDRLKELCRALDLDDHGKEKATIVDRIFGSAPEQGSLKLPGVDRPSAPPGTFLFYGCLNAAPLLLSKVHASGHGTGVLSTEFLDRLEFVTPPSDICDRLTQPLVALNSRISANSQESRTLAALRDTLLPKLLSGEVRP